MIKNTETVFKLSQFQSIHESDITSEVINALDVIHDKKMEMIKNYVPRFLRTAFMDFAGVKNSQIYNSFKDGNAVYLSKLFIK